MARQGAKVAIRRDPFRVTEDIVCRHGRAREFRVGFKKRRDLLLAFLALALTYQNWVSIACIMIPISIALAYRIYIEEIALEHTFGESYHAYAKSTKRLIPGVF